MREIKLRIDAEGIMMDVAQRSFVMSRTPIRGADGQPAMAESMFVSKEPENVEVLKRAINTHMKGLTGAVEEFAKVIDETNDVGGDIDPTIDKGGDYAIMITVPDNFNMTGTPALGALTHGYLTEMAMWEWYRLRDADKAAESLKAAQGIMAEIQTLLRGRIRPGRPVSVDLGVERVTIGSGGGTAEIQLTSNGSWRVE